MGNTLKKSLCAAAANALMFCILAMVPAGAEPTLRVLVIDAGGAFCAESWVALNPIQRVVPTPLHGGVTDARLVISFARSIYGVKPTNIWLLGLDKTDALGGAYTYLGKRATRKSVRDALSLLAQVTGSEDYSLVFFTTHGGFLPDQDRKSRETHYICAYDGPVYDFEMDHELSGKHGLITEVYDCCFAAGQFRSPLDPTAFGTVKFVKMLDESKLGDDLARQKVSAHFQKSTEELPKGGNRIAFGACGMKSVAQEIPIPAYAEDQNPWASVFTRALYRTLLLDGPCRCSDLLSHVQSILTREHRPQEPQISPIGEDRPFFAPASLPPGAIYAEHGQLMLGQVAGIARQTRFRSRRGAVIRVASIGGFHATLQPEKSGSISNGVLTLLATPFPPTPKGTPAPILVNPKGGVVPPGPVAQDGLTVTYDEHTGKVTLDSLTTSTPIKPTSPAVPPAQLAESVAVANGSAWRIWNWIDELAARSAHPGTLTISCSARIYGPGENLVLHVESDEPGWITLLGREPDGKVTLDYPNFNDKEIKVQQCANLPVTTGGSKENQVKYCVDLPVSTYGSSGVTHFVAIRTARPMPLPTAILARAEGWASYTISPGRTSEFLEWLRGSLAAHRGLRDAGVPLLSPEDVRIAWYDIVVNP